MSPTSCSSPTIVWRAPVLMQTARRRATSAATCRLLDKYLHSYRAHKYQAQSDASQRAPMLTPMPLVGLPPARPHPAKTLARQLDPVGVRLVAQAAEPASGQRAREPCHHRSLIVLRLRCPLGRLTPKRTLVARWHAGLDAPPPASQPAVVSHALDQDTPPTTGRAHYAKHEPNRPKRFGLFGLRARARHHHHQLINKSRWLAPVHGSC